MVSRVCFKSYVYFCILNTVKLDRDNLINTSHVILTNLCTDGEMIFVCFSVFYDFKSLLYLMRER